jgi:hypothetical protein
MKDTQTPASAEAFEAAVHCPLCGTTFTAEASDVAVDLFEAPSAVHSVIREFFVVCPANGCATPITIPTDDIGILVRRRLVEDKLAASTKKR